MLELFLSAKFIFAAVLIVVGYLCIGGKISWNNKGLGGHPPNPTLTNGGIVCFLIALFLVGWELFYIAPFECNEWEGEWRIYIIKPGSVQELPIVGEAELLLEEGKNKVIFRSKKLGTVKFTPTSHKENSCARMSGRYWVGNQSKPFDLSMDIDRKGFIAKIYTNKSNEGTVKEIWIGSRK